MLEKSPNSFKLIVADNRNLRLIEVKSVSYILFRVKTIGHIALYEKYRHNVPMVTKEQIGAVLKTIPDPELGISIWDLGLIYDMDIDDKGNVHIVMTLTSIGCPLFGTIQRVIEEGLKEIKGVKTGTVDLTFEPPWSMDKMTPEAKAQLGF